MATTSAFGWETPDDTDLVKDGAAAIRTLGNSIDTSMSELKGGTTGQVLSKTSNTDMDFTWVAQDDSNAIQNAIVDAKGDLIAASAADTPARLAVGNNGETLVADSSTSTGLRYQATNAAGKNAIVNGAFEVWQRGTSFTATGFTADRWAVSTPGSNTWSRSTTAPSGFNYSMNWVTAGSYPTLYNYVELPVTGAKGNFVGTWTLSFYAKASTATTMGAGGNWVDGSSRANAVTIIDSSVSLTTSWQRFTIPINFDGSSPAGTSKAVEMGFYIPSGGATVNITGVQLEIGSVPTAFTRAGGTIQAELAACQRYYYQAASGGVNLTVCPAHSYTSTQMNATVTFPVTMRVAPTCIASSGTNYYSFNRAGGDDYLNSLSLLYPSTVATNIYNNTDVSGTAGQAGTLYTYNASATIAFNAEL